MGRTDQKMTWEQPPDDAPPPQGGIAGRLLAMLRTRPPGEWLSVEYPSRSARRAGYLRVAKLLRERSIAIEYRARGPKLYARLIPPTELPPTEE